MGTAGCSGGRKSLFLLTSLVMVLLTCAGWSQAPLNQAIIPVPRKDAWWLARHEDKVAEAKRGGVDLLFVGDSITQNYEKKGPAPDEVFWPTWEGLFAPHHAMNLGFSGDETQHVLWRLRHGEVDGLAPSNVVLLIGTNNTGHGQDGDGTAVGVEAVVTEIHRLMPRAHLLLLGILPSAVSAEKSAADARINSLLRARYGGSGEVRLLELDGIFLRDGVLDAGLFYDPGLGPGHRPLHPNTEGQRRMAEVVSKALYGGTPATR